MPSVFITGIAGFLGSHLADEFLHLGYDVSGLDNLIGGYRDYVPEEATFYEIDCRDPSLPDILKKESPEIVIHTAATAYEGLSVFSPSFVTSNIYEASVSVFTSSIRLT